MALSPQWLDELKSRITLSALIQRDVKLQRAGREWKACCPFHNEATPSFYVNDQKGFYHCFGCQAHGSAIDWMIEQRGLQFMDAVKELAAEAGMDVPAPDPRAAERAEKRASLHDVMQAAQNWFVARLASDEGIGARQYLERRGLSQRMIEHFGFGYAPDDKISLKKALSQFDEKMLVEAGLLIEVEDKIPYSRFRGRVMLPIQDARGRVIAFGGRILEDRDGVAKYLNSPDTPLFDKGRNLYNLHRAGPASRKSDRVIAVEGYMDVVALAQAGFEDAVAPMGTALTEHQVELLWRMADKPVLCFDGDAAGKRAAMRAAERALPLLRPGHSLQIVQLPAGLDPDDLLQKHGSEAFQGVLAQTKSLLDLIWENERDAQPLKTPEDKAGLRARLIEQAFSIEDKEIQKLYRRALLDRYYEHAYPKFKKFNRNSTEHGFLDAESLAQLKYYVEDGAREILCRAVFSALAKRPFLIPLHLERLYEYVPKDVSVQFALDVFFDVAESAIDDVDHPTEALAKIASWSCPLAFPFLQEDLDDNEVSRQINEALIVLIDRPIIRRELASASERYGKSFSEKHREEQAYWRKRDQEVTERMRNLRTIDS